MKNWLLEQKKSIVISVLMTLLPMLIGIVLYDRLPDTMVSHWGADGVADRTAGKFFMVFCVPMMLAVLNLLAILITAADPGHRNQNRKALGIVFWIMPGISLLVMGSVYAIALDRTWDMGLYMGLATGAMFLVIGNYMPKVKQNSTLGIKIYWTLHNEENWNRTHRLAGKLWVVGGLVMLLGSFLPVKWLIGILLADLLVMVLVPTVYSWRIYKAHTAQGIEYAAPPKTGKEKLIAGISAGMFVLILAGVAVVMLTGNITYTLDDDMLRIDADYSDDFALRYEKMDSVELCQEFDVGARAFGFGSPRLSMGSFENTQLGTYTLYAYNSCPSVILIRSGENWLAINGATAEETRQLYEDLLSRVGE